MDGQYDEFGNFIGQVEDDSEGGSEDSAELDEDEGQEGSADGGSDAPPAELAAAAGSQVVLHEDKRYYPEAGEVFGKGTEVIVGEEDTQTIEQPIIAPKVVRNFDAAGRRKDTRLDDQQEFLLHLMKETQFVRNCCVVGHIGHGKTSLLDYLVGEPHGTRYTDTRIDEQHRGLSIKAAPMSMLVSDPRGKSYVFSMLDCPGHVNFHDEVAAAMRLCDGAVVVVDAVEGVMVAARRALELAAIEGLPVVLVINKVDRLILELKLPPPDAYRKLLHVIGEVNEVLRDAPRGGGAADAAAAPEPQRLSPELGNVVFASTKFAWSFTLRSFARIYRDAYGPQVDVDRLARRLWGEIYYNAESRLFLPKPRQDADGESDRHSFVALILEPLWKIYAQVVGEDPKDLRPVLDEIGVRLSKAELRGDVEPLLRSVASRFFADASGFVEAVVSHVPDPRRSAPARVRHLYTGVLEDEAGRGMQTCDSAGELMVYITKLYHRGEGQAFDAFGRVFSGTLRADAQVRVLGEAYTEEDPEDMSLAETHRLWIAQGRQRVQVPAVPAGMWALIEGIDGSIGKTATVCRPRNERAAVFRPLSTARESVVKIAVEPLRPSELPKMVEGLRKINMTYPSAQTRVEESGEHVVIGTGEMYLDSIMHDLRRMYADIEVKVADPVTTFSETVIETSSIKCFAETPNKKNKITMIAEPLEKGLAEDIASGAVSLQQDRKAVQAFFQTRYDWDILAARSVWAFGPDSRGPNILVDDTLASEVDKGQLASVRDSVVQGFQWSTREGPLCDEPIRNVKFKLLDAIIAQSQVHRNAGQVIPTARRVAYSAFLMATPRLMEPVYYVEVQTPVDCINPIYTVLSRRRGHVTADDPKPGTPLYTLKAYVPVMDSFGLECDLRTHTQGQAFCQSVFHHWSIVPGDPLDKDIVLRPLEPSQPHQLARDFMVKTRRRKGMSEDVSINKYFDDPMLLELAKQDVDFNM
eukprot:TRINITY_DN517_c0_g2_i1.p1 TRINITY_DN517_c0_g2~~TRINITY_DN517_c0_g2_i1.p1  ORF type:complete len:1008 (+),score=372.63 TRINITY_DN517_c0_g2_i1:91-3024(+)